MFFFFFAMFLVASNLPTRAQTSGSALLSCDTVAKIMGRKVAGFLGCRSRAFGRSKVMSCGFEIDFVTVVSSKVGLFKFKGFGVDST